MGVFTRFRDIVSSNINAMLDRAEDPEKMIKLMIREMEDTLVELKVSCAGVIAGRKKAERATGRGRGPRPDVGRTGGPRRPPRQGRPGPRGAARKAPLHRDGRGVAWAKSPITAGLIEQYRHDMVELEDKLATAKEKRSLLVQRHRRAAGKKRAQEDIRRMDSSESMARFEKLESRIEQMEAEADLVNFGRKPAVDERFDDLGRDDEIEKELERSRPVPTVLIPPRHSSPAPLHPDGATRHEHCHRCRHCLRIDRHDGRPRLRHRPGPGQGPPGGTVPVRAQGPGR